MDSILHLLEKVQAVVWGPPTMILLIGTGLYFTLRLKCLQVTRLPRALRYIFEKEEGKVMCRHSAPCVRLWRQPLEPAVSWGCHGPARGRTGCAFSGCGFPLLWGWLQNTRKVCLQSNTVPWMKTGRSQAAQCTISRTAWEKDGSGLQSCLPFWHHHSTAGLRHLPQVNAITESASEAFHLPVAAIGIVVTIAVAAVVLGGLKSISRVAELVVPVMAAAYVIGSFAVLFVNASAIPRAFSLIFESAFTPHAMLGGAGGTILISVMTAMRTGFARGIYTNEAGLGSSPIVVAAAKTKSCVRQGLSP